MLASLPRQCACKRKDGEEEEHWAWALALCMVRTLGIIYWRFREISVYLITD